MRKLVKFFSVLMVTAGSFAFGQTAKKAELSANNVSFSSAPASKLSITIRFIIGRTSKDCGGFGICKGTTVDVGLKQQDSSNYADGYLVENGAKGKSYVRLDLASQIDKAKYDDTLYLDSDIIVNIKGQKYTLLAGEYLPQFDSNSNGSYYVTIK